MQNKKQIFYFCNCCQVPSLTSMFTTCHDLIYI